MKSLARCLKNLAPGLPEKSVKTVCNCPLWYWYFWYNDGKGNCAVWIVCARYIQQQVLSWQGWQWSTQTWRQSTMHWYDQNVRSLTIIHGSVALLGNRCMASKRPCVTYKPCYWACLMTGPSWLDTVSRVTSLHSRFVCICLVKHYVWNGLK